MLIRQLNMVKSSSPRRRGPSDFATYDTGFPPSRERRSLEFSTHLIAGSIEAPTVKFQHGRGFPGHLPLECAPMLVFEFLRCEKSRSSVNHSSSLNHSRPKKSDLVCIHVTCHRSSTVATLCGARCRRINRLECGDPDTHCTGRRC